MRVHRRVDVAEQLDDARVGEGLGVRRAGGPDAGVELVRLGDGKNVVIDAVVIAELDRRAECRGITVDSAAAEIISAPDSANTSHTAAGSTVRPCA